MRRPNLSARTRALLVLAVIAVTAVAVQLPWVAAPPDARAADGPYEPRVMGQVSGPDGEPIVGAELRIGREAIRKYSGSVTGWWSVPEATSNEAGRFDFRATRQRSVWESNGHLWVGDELWLTAAAPGYAPSLVRLPRAEDAPVQVDVELGRGCELSGVVTDESGAPVSGVSVELLSPDGAASYLTYPPRVPRLPHPLKASTDAKGRFEFTSLPETTYRVRATGDKFLAPERLVQAPDSVRIRLSRPIAAAIQLVDHLGVPVAAELVCDHVEALHDGLGSQRGFHKTARSASPGSFCLFEVARGEWRLHVFPLDPTQPRHQLTVRLDGDDITRIELPPAHPWSGRLLDASGAPIGDQDLTLHTVGDEAFVVSHTKTAADGTFTLWRTDDGPHSVELRPDGVRISGLETTAPLHIRLPGERTLQIVLSEELSVRAALKPIAPSSGLRYSYRIDLRGHGPDGEGRFTYLADVDYELTVEPKTAHGMLERFERVGPATRVVPAGTERVVVEYRSTRGER